MSNIEAPDPQARTVDIGLSSGNSRQPAECACGPLLAISAVADSVETGSPSASMQLLSQRQKALCVMIRFLEHSAVGCSAGFATCK
jgi:hypothetical protein